MTKRIVMACIVVLFLVTPVFALTNVDQVGLRRGILSSTTTATSTAGECPATALIGRRSVIIHNTGSTTVYIGHSAVTTANGYELKEDEAISIDATDDIDIYVITASGTAEVRTEEVIECLILIEGF